MEGVEVSRWPHVAGILERSASILNNLIGIGVFATGLAIAALAWFPSASPTAQVILISVGSVLVGVGVGLVIAFVRLRRNDDPGYRWISVDQVYELAEDNPRVQRMVTTNRVQATRDNVLWFTDRTQWTGAIQPRFSLLSPSQSLMLSPATFEKWRHYVVHFHEPLKKGQVADIVLQANFLNFTVPDEMHYTSKTPSAPVRDGIALHLRLGKNAPQSIESYGAGAYAPGIGNSTKLADLMPVLDRASGIATLRIKRPRVGVRYQLSVRLRLSDDTTNLGWNSTTSPWAAVDPNK
ncbi:hypothetical protein, partial [Agromyces bracchium]